MTPSRSSFLVYDRNRGDAVLEHHLQGFPGRGIWIYADALVHDLLQQYVILPVARDPRVPPNLVDLCSSPLEPQASRRIQDNCTMRIMQEAFAVALFVIILLLIAFELVHRTVAALLGRRFWSL
jgi:hypothetical protein